MSGGESEGGEFTRTHRHWLAQAREKRRMDPPRHVEDKHAPGALADILQCINPSVRGLLRRLRSGQYAPEALAPVGTRLGEKKLAELTLAVSAVSGFENYITMKDIQG